MGEDASRSVAPATDVSSMPEGPVFLDSGSAFSYRCKACGQCCRDTRVVLNPYDVICLAGHLGISTGRLVRQFLVLTPEGGFLRHRLNGDCVFLDGTRCLVYPARPLQCRIYPLRIAQSPEHDRFLQLEARPASAGVYGTEGNVAQFLRQQHAESGQHAAGVYRRLFVRLYEQGLASASGAEPPGAGDDAPVDAAQLLATVMDADRMIHAYLGEHRLVDDTERKAQIHVAALEAWIAGEIEPTRVPADPADEMSEADNRHPALTGTLSHILWPRMTHHVHAPGPSAERICAIPDGRAAVVWDVLRQMDETQWWPAQRLRERQFAQITRLYRHFRATSPWYRDILERAGIAGIDAITSENFHRLPILTRADLRSAGEAAFSSAPPPDHGPITRVTTSGSTGRPVTVLCTALTDAVHWAAFMRNDVWHRRVFSEKFAFIQSYRDLEFARYPAGAVTPGWNELCYTGPLAILNLSTATIEQQLEWLLREQPAYLLSVPSNLAGIARLCLRRAVKLPWLKNVSTIGEHLSPAQRRVMRDAWGIPVCETYGCTEATYIAFQHPEKSQLMVQSECVYVEILDAKGRPCGIGHPGRVVITTLHNFAMPIIRYEVGDLAVWGEPDGERGLPVIGEVLGRTRDVIRLPNGEKAFPLRWGEDIDRLAPVRQWQLIQKSYTGMELRLAADRPLSDDEEQSILQAFARVLGTQFKLSIRYLDEIPRSVGGKYHEFLSELVDRDD